MATKRSTKTEKAKPKQRTTVKDLPLGRGDKAGAVKGGGRKRAQCIAN